MKALGWAKAGVAALTASFSLGVTAGTEAPDLLSFRWHMGSLGGQPPQPLALLVPVKLGGRFCDMQLDTGANAAVTWHSSAPTGEATQPLTIMFGSLQASTLIGASIQRTIHSCTEGEPVGTLGNAFFERGTLTLDIAKQRVAWQEGSTLNDDPRARRFFYAAPPLSQEGWQSEGGHIFVELDAKQAGKGYGLLDTGATSAELGVMDAQWWSTLTGSPATQGPNVKNFSVNSWGRSLTCALAPTVVEITIDDFGPAARRATYCPELGYRPPIRLIGLVGLAPFMQSVLTIDYPGRLWRVDTARATP